MLQAISQNSTYDGTAMVETVDLEGKVLTPPVLQAAAGKILGHVGHGFGEQGGLGQFTAFIDKRVGDTMNAWYRATHPNQPAHDIERILPDGGWIARLDELVTLPVRYIDLPEPAVVIRAWGDEYITVIYNAATGYATIPTAGIPDIPADLSLDPHYRPVTLDYDKLASPPQPFDYEDYRSRPLQPLLEAMASLMGASGIAELHVADMEGQPLTMLALQLLAGALITHGEDISGYHIALTGMAQERLVTFVGGGLGLTMPTIHPMLRTAAGAALDTERAIRIQRTLLYEHGGAGEPQIACTVSNKGDTPYCVMLYNFSVPDKPASLSGSVEEGVSDG